jgi:hypothetical protein
MSSTRDAGQHPIQRRGERFGLCWIGHLVVAHRACHVAAAGIQQWPFQVQPEHLSHTPTEQSFAADLVPIGGMAFQHDDLVTVPGHHSGQRRPSDSATDHNHIS